MNDVKIRWDDSMLRGVVENTALYRLDLSRGRITVDPSGGYWVEIGPPLFGGLVGYRHVSKYRCGDARVAEGELLSALYSMQKAERLAARVHRTYGRDMTWITRTPLTQDEIDEHRARLEHAEKMARGERELNHEQAKQVALEKGKAALANLVENYNVVVQAPASKAAKSTGTGREAPNAVHRRTNRSK
ncbi:MAG: hypothetical protein I8H93_10695 [Pseudomonadales bacterium]|nr:hypothetical protein [Pseudomonadales bacterium]